MSGAAADVGAEAASSDSDSVDFDIYNDGASHAAAEAGPEAGPPATAAAGAAASATPAFELRRPQQPQEPAQATTVPQPAPEFRGATAPQAAPKSQGAPPLARLGMAAAAASAAAAEGAGSPSGGAGFAPGVARAAAAEALAAALLTAALCRGVAGLVRDALAFLLAVWCPIFQRLSWPPEATKATRLVTFMVFAWSTASHLARGGSWAGPLADAGIVGRAEISEDELEELIPLEMLEDVLLPLLGLGVGVLGVQLTLGLSLAEPLFVIALPAVQHAFRSLHERLTSWHLGGLFGHPVLVAQVVAVRAEGSQGHCAAGVATPLRNRNLMGGQEEAAAAQEVAGGRRVAALGAMVGAYALGAVAGSAVRRAAEVYSVGVPQARLASVCLLVSLNLALVAQNGELLSGGHASHGGGHGQGHGHDHGEEPVRRSCGYAVAAAQLSLLEARALRVCAGVRRVLLVGALCADLLIARALFVLGLMIVIGPAPMPPVDLLKRTPLGRGFSVPWFDLVGATVAGLVVPLAVGPPLRLRRRFCLVLVGAAALTACGTAALASAHAMASSYWLTMCAGMALSALASVAGLTLAVEAVERVEQVRRGHLENEAEGGGVGPSEEGAGGDASGAAGAASAAAAAGHHDDGIALGWGLFASGLSQSFGTRIGSVLYAKHSWLGVVIAAGAACLLGFWQLSHPPATRRR